MLFPFSYVLVHLGGDLFVEAFLLLTTVFVFTFNDGGVLRDLLVVLAHHSLVEALLLGDLLFVPLKGLPPCHVLGRVGVLNHTEVLLRHHIATVVESLHLTSHHR